MERGAPARNRLLAEMRAEIVTKGDGRYLIYYSWPGDEPEREAGQRRTDEIERPPQQPWSPETRPTDV